MPATCTDWVNPFTGAVVRTIHVGESPDAVAIDPGTDRVVVANLDDASVSVLDARRGIVLRTVSVGAQPLAVAVDGQTSRAFVVSYGDTVDQPARWWEPWVQALWRRLPPSAQRLRPDLTAQATVRSVPGSVAVLDTSRM